MIEPCGVGLASLGRERNPRWHRVRVLSPKARAGAGLEDLVILNPPLKVTLRSREPLRADCGAWLIMTSLPRGKGR